MMFTGRFCMANDQPLVIIIYKKTILHPNSACYWFHSNELELKLMHPF
uniref:Uncharacterized protein n=1 Tax=Rhizophora mucronata TaxID=61149 RepID=A0A2P2JHI0_RHIMU